MKKKRGQIEYAAIVGIALVVSLTLFYIMGNNIRESNKITKTEDAVTTLADKADAINFLGKRSKDVAVIDVPKAVIARYIGERSITMTIIKKGVPYNITKETTPFLVGELQDRSGLQQVSLQKINDTLVLIGNKPYLFNVNPGCVLFNELAPGIWIILEGIGFKQNATLLQDGLPFAGIFQVINGEKMSFNASAVDFKLPNHQYQMSVRNPSGSASNEICFETVLPKLEFCSCYPPNPGD